MLPDHYRNFGLGGAVRLVIYVLSFVFVSAFGDDLSELKRQQFERAIGVLLANVSPPGALPGTIIASPSLREPNYFRHWVRDGGHVVQIIVEMWKRASGQEKESLEKHIWDFVDLTIQQQKHLNEPVFNPDATPITEEWGRPQHDGLALRSIPLMMFEEQLVRENRSVDVTGLRSGSKSLSDVIDTDISAILKFGDFGFDIWEEVLGNHFYTRMVHRKALIMALRRLINSGLPNAREMRQRIEQLEKEIQNHWDPNRGYIVSSLNVAGGIAHKQSHLDSQVVLGVIHGQIDDFFSVDDSRVRQTVFHLESEFNKLYPINKNSGFGPAIGRYVEDDWNGNHRGGEGNPWMITTEAFGEYYDSIAAKWQRSPGIAVNVELAHWLVNAGVIVEVPSIGVKHPNTAEFQELLGSLHRKADMFYSRVLHHLGENGEFHEQYSRHDGYPRGPQRLTWSCAAFVSGFMAREARTF